jgi:hypothetical protein
MLIDIVVTTVAANPTIALQPRDYLVPVGFRLWHAVLFLAQIYAQLKARSTMNAQISALGDSASCSAY